MDELFAPDYVTHIPVLPTLLYGIEAWQERTVAYFTAFPDLHLAIEDLIADGEQVAARLI